MGLRLSKFEFVCFIFIVSLFSCTYHDVNHVFDCTSSTLTISLGTKTDPSGCNTNDGTITVMPNGGLAPYLFSSDGITFKNQSTFQNLGAGTFIIYVKDSNGCQKQLSGTLTNLASTLDVTVSTTSDTGCSTHNGSITVKGSGGVTPYQYQLNSTGYTTSSVFSTLAAGIYTVSIKDAKGCTKSITATVATGVGSASYATDIAPLLTTYCNTSRCHSANSGRSLTTYTNANAQASGIKSRTASGNMPPGGGLTQTQISLIACWVNAGAPNN